MSKPTDIPSRFHDLFAAVLGAFAAFCLITSPWNVDTEGPDPFYKGPLIFPIMVLSMMILTSLPACKRLLSPAADSAWQLDGDGFPRKTLAVLGLLVAMLGSLNLIGLEISALAFLAASLYLLGHRGPVKLVVLPLVMTGLIVLIFKYFLDVFFPTPLIAEWFWEQSVWHNLISGAAAALTLANLGSLVFGTFVGIVVGILPGIGPMVGMVMLLPFTFALSPDVALSLLLGVFCGGYFGGAVPAILMRTPGVPSSLVTYTFRG